jgi:hypothetical protein
LQVVNPVKTPYAQFASQPKQLSDLMKFWRGINHHLIKPWHRAGDGLEGLARQKGNVGIRVMLSNRLKGLCRDDDIPQRAEFDHKDAGFCGAKVHHGVCGNLPRPEGHKSNIFSISITISII